MPTFAFSGRTRGGETVSGERAADSMDAAVAALRREQILVTRINPAKAAAAPKKGKAGKRVGAKNVASPLLVAVKSRRRALLSR